MACHRQAAGGLGGTRLEGKPRDQPEQQRRPQQRRHGPGRDQHRPEAAQGLQQQIGGRQQQGAEDRCPQQPLAELPHPQQSHHGRRRQPDETYQPHHAHHTGGDEDREPKSGKTQLLEGDPQTAGTGIVQLQHAQGADQQGGQGPSHQQPRQQVEDAAPAVLGQGAAAPHQQALELLLEEQQQPHADGRQIEVDHQAGEYDNHRVELATPGQGKH
ncbi:hypothetical protein D3C85_738240 [compost metagenome]